MTTGKTDILFQKAVKKKPHILCSEKHFWSILFVIEFFVL